MKRNFLNVYFVGLLFLSLIPMAMGQVNNDECFSALYIEDISNYCSGPMAFTNVGATQSQDPKPQCWDDEYAESDVWFYVRPRKAGLLLRWFGQSVTNSNTLQDMAVTVYDGNCTDLNRLICRQIPRGQQNSIESSLSGLTIGAALYIRVSSSAATAGSFELCLEEYNPVAMPESDCRTSVVLCDKSMFFVENLESTGVDINELSSTNCVREEFASAWYTWTAEESGTLTFTLTPTSPDPNEDLDFAIFRLPNGITDCRTKELVLCMASGETQGNTPAQNAPCLGPTGLRDGSTDIEEVGGCMPGDDNFIAPLDMIAGESYGLLINNFSRSQTGSNFGFTIDFGGTGSFQGPTPDFNILATDGFQCDQEIIFSNLSNSPTDQIVGYDWNFGEGAIPSTAQGVGPHTVVYSSYGPKLAALTIETTRGCLITDIQELDLVICCTVEDEITLSASITNPQCAGESNGSAQVAVGSGSAMALYSFEDGPFLLNNIFNGLSSGSYIVRARDAKGCEATTTINIEDPTPLSIQLSSELDSVLLGSGTSITSILGPNDRNFTYQWTPTAGLSCTDCPNPDVIPPGTTTYTLMATDQFGCSIADQITIATNNIKRFFAPNIVNLSSNLGNDRFVVDGNIAIEQIEFLNVYDRWGSNLYSENNLSLQDPNYIGWDGRVNGQKVTPGVYVWIAKVIYIDGEIEHLSGDVTIFD